MVVIFIPVGNHYFQALASTLQFVAQVCDRLWLVPATDRAFLWLRSAFGSEHTSDCLCGMWQHLSMVGNFAVAATCRPSVLGSTTKTRPPVAKQSGQCARAHIGNKGQTQSRWVAVEVWAQTPWTDCISALYCIKDKAPQIFGIRQDFSCLKGIGSGCTFSLQDLEYFIHLMCSWVWKGSWPQNLFFYFYFFYFCLVCIFYSYSNNF